MSKLARICIRPIGRVLPALAGLAALPIAAAAQAQETGVWLDDSGKGAVEIYVCADRADRLCGRIVWLKEPLNAEGVPKRDKYNPTASLQTRPICGLPILGNLQKSTEGGYDEGWIYDPKVGKSYSAAIQLASGGRLTVTGYVGVKFLGKTFTWTRAPADLVRCNSTASAKQIKAAKAAQADTKAKGADAAKAAPKQAAAAEAPSFKPAAAPAPAAPSSPTREANAEQTSVPSFVEESTLSSPAPVAAEPVQPSKPALETLPAEKAAVDSAPAQKAAAPKKPATAKAVAKPTAAKTAAVQGSGQTMPRGPQKAGAPGGSRPGLMPWELYGIGNANDVTR